MRRHGTIELRSVRDDRDKCAGRFRFTGLKIGVADLHCDDGAEATLTFNALGLFSGYGAGSTRRGPASFTFGLSPEEAAGHLTLPPGRKLVRVAEGLKLESVGLQRSAHQGPLAFEQTDSTAARTPIRRDVPAYN